MLGFSLITFNSPFLLILHEPYERVNFFEAATNDILKLFFYEKS